MPNLHANKEALQLNRELLSFIKHSPTAFHAIQNLKEELLQQHFTELKENEKWLLEAGHSYFVIRNDSSLIAFTIPAQEFHGIRVTASHSDSPCFKIKEQPEITVENQYIKLNVEPYGGMLCAPWFDRPLSVAGRLIIREGRQLKSKLVRIDRDLLLIPNLAIHINRKVNEGYHYQMQTDMLPLMGGIQTKDSFMRLIAAEAQVKPTDILGSDLFLFNRSEGVIWGAAEEYISAPRLDDLQCAFAALRGFLEAKRQQNLSVYCVFDNEEVGSGTKQGAESSFLADTLRRINLCLGRSEEEYLMMLAEGFMLSADNAHAIHPNHPELADPVNRPYLNQGIVIKYNANQKYCTDGVSAAMFKDLCEQADVPYQSFTNRSDMPGGSTLGNIANTKVPMNTVDIGLPQLSMHSPYETAGIQDTLYLVRATKQFYA